MFLRFTVRVWAAQEATAGADAGAILAGQRVSAVAVGQTLALGRARVRQNAWKI